MAGIVKPLELKDKFSSVVDRWISSLKSMVESSNALDSSLDQLAAAQEETIVEMTEWETVLQNSAEKGLGAKNSIEVIEDAFRSLIPIAEENQELFIEGMANMIQALDDYGYSWTENAEGINTNVLLVNNSIDKLVKNGLLKLEDQGKKTSKIMEFLKDRFKSLRKEAVEMDPTMKKLLAIGASFFSVSKLISMFKNGITRAPDEMLEPWNKLKALFRDITDTPMVAALDAMNGQMNVLIEKLESPAGQKFMDGLSAIGHVIGTVVGKAFGLLARFVDFVANNFDTVMLGASILLGLFAAKMLFVAGATLVAHWPLVLMFGAVVALVGVLSQFGVTAGDVFEFIGGAAGGLFVFVYNLIAQTWNALAAFGEFFANFLDNPFREIEILTTRLYEYVLGILENIAGAIDAVFGSSLADAVAGWRDQLQGRVDDLTGGANRITLDRMEELDYNTVINGWAEKGRGLGDSLTTFDATQYELKAIDANTKSIAKSADNIDQALHDAELAALLDVAERQFVNMVNLTAQTPVITINGANTGNTQADRINLANTIRDILLEEAASGSAVASYPI